MKPFWFLSLYHARSLRDDEARARSAAALLNTPAMRAMRRIAVTVKNRETEHGANSPELLLAHLQHPAARGVLLDSGRSGELVAHGVITTVLHYEPDPGIEAAMNTTLVLPYVADDREAVLDVFCTLAELLDAAVGACAVEPSFQTAQNATASARPSAADLPTYTVMTPDRIRYRATSGYLNTQRHCGIGGPEWGTFLGPGHLARLPAATLMSPAFDQVRQLAHGGAFIRLSDDPLDNLTDGILGLVDRARAALEPIVIHDLSDVRI